MSIYDDILTKHGLSGNKRVAGWDDFLDPYERVLAKHKLIDAGTLAQQRAEEQKAKWEEEAALNQSTPEEPGFGDYIGARANSAYESAVGGTGAIAALGAEDGEPSFEELDQLNAEGRSAEINQGLYGNPERRAAFAAMLNQRRQEKATKDFAGVRQALQEEQAITQRYQPGFLAELAGDAVGSLPSLAPLAAGAVAGAITRSPAAAAAAAAATAPLPASQALFQSFTQAKLSGASDEDAARYATKQAGIEYLLETIPPAKLGKTLAGSIAKRALREGATEAGTELGSIGIDFTDLPQAAPKTFAEGAERVGKAGLLGSLMGGAVVTLPTAAEFKASKTPEIPKTGDPDIDLGIEEASKLAEEILGEKPKTADKVPEQLKLFPDPELKQGSLFGAEFDVPAAQAEAARAAKEAVAPQTAEIAPGVESILGVPPQTTEEQLLARALQEKATKDARDTSLLEKTKESLKAGRIRREAQSPNADKVVLNTLKQKYPLALSTKRTPEVVAQQEAFAREYDTYKRNPNAVQGLLVSDRVQQMKDTKGLMEQRAAALDPARERDFGPAPVQQSLELPVQAEMFKNTPTTQAPVTEVTPPQPAEIIPDTVAQARAALGKSNEVDEADALKVDNFKGIVDRTLNMTPEKRQAHRNLFSKMDTGQKAIAVLKPRVKNLTDKRLLSKLETSLAANNVKIVLTKNQREMGGGLGAYNAETNTIRILDADSGVHGMDAEVLLHELAHAATVGVMRQRESGQKVSPAAETAIKELEMIRGQVASFYDKKYKGDNSPKAQYAKAMIEKSTANARELVAYVYTNPQLREMLNTDTPSLWEKIKVYIGKLLGVEKNVVDRILNLSDQIIDAQTRQDQRAVDFKAKYADEKYTPVEEPKLDPNQVADDLVFRGPFSDKGSTQDVDRTEAGGGDFMKWFNMAFSPYGIKTKKFAEISEATQGVIQRMLAEEQAAKVRIDNLRRELKYTPGKDDFTPEGIKRLLSNEKTKPLGLEQQAMRERYKTAALALADEYLIGKQKLTKKDLAIVNKIKSNLDEYMSKAYAVDIRQKVVDVPGVKTVGEQYVENVVEAWNRGKNAKPGDPIFGSLFYVRAKNAVDFFKDRVLGFPKDWETNMDMATLQNRYKLLMGHAYSQVDPETLAERVSTMKRETMVKEIKAILPETQALLDSKAEQLMFDALGATEKGDKVSTPTMAFYRGRNSIDRTILTPRKDIPWELAQLWGEIKDPFDAMFITMQRLANTLAKTKMMRYEAERGLREGFLFPAEKRPPGTKFNKQIRGADFGALDGLYTTEAYFTQLEAMTKADVLNTAALDAYPAGTRFVMGAIEVASSAARWTKWSDVVLTPDNYAQNVMGAPVNLIMNGNAQIKTYLEGAKIAKKIVYDMRRGKVDPSSLQTYQANILDSALVGELKAEFNRGVYKDVLDDFLRDYDRSFTDRFKRAVVNKGTPAVTGAISAREVLTDVYAMMDLWSKIANFKADYNRLKSFSKRNDLTWDEDKLVRMAGFRTRNTNLSQQRAAGLVKGLEKTGITTYMTYHWEMYRTAGTNILVALNDIKQGLKYKDKEWTAHGITRLAGATSAITLNSTGIIAQQAWKAGLLGWLGATAMDDDNMDKIQKALGDFGLGRTLMPAGVDDKGNPIFLDAGRSNPVEPVNGPFRAAVDALARGEGAEKAVDDALTALSGLYYLNPMWKGIYNSLFNPTKTSTLERQNPQLYSDVFTALTDLGMDSTTANRFVLGVEQPFPREGTALLRPAEQSRAGDPPMVKFLTAMGHPVVKFDVAEQAKYVAIELGNSTRSLRASLLDAARGGTVPSEEELEGVYLNALTNERKAFQKVVDYVEGAKAAGFTRTKIYGYLAEQNVNKAVIADALRGKFRSNLISDGFTERLDNWESDKISKLGDKAKARAARRELERALNGLNNKYRNFTGEED